MTWIRPHTHVVPRVREADEQNVARYRTYCAMRSLTELDPASAWEFAESLVSELPANPLRKMIQSLRRLFLDSDCPDPFAGTAAAQASMQALLARAAPTSEAPLYTSRTYHDIIDALPATNVGIRDAAMIGLIYAGRLRAFDIEALDPEHAVFSLIGLRAELVTAKRAPLVLRRLPDPMYCPVALLERWFRLIDFTGPGFRACSRGRIREKRLSYRGIIWTVRQHVLRLGQRGTVMTSLKGTMIAVAAMRGVDDGRIRGQSGCRADATIAKWKARAHIGTATQRLGL